MTNANRSVNAPQWWNEHHLSPFIQLIHEHFNANLLISTSLIQFQRTFRTLYSSEGCVKVEFIFSTIPVFKLR